MADSMFGVNTIFPPIVETYTPAFIYNQSCRVYFNLSAYNGISDIAGIQIVINEQSSNISVLDKELYPYGIKIEDMSSIDYDEIKGMYFLTIEPDDIKNKKFTVGNYYKAQFRFISSALKDNIAESSDSNLQQWLVNNRNYFSEWSTITLLKPISNFTVNLGKFSFSTRDGDIIKSMKTTDTSELVGEVRFEDDNDSEFLQKYRIKIYDTNKNDDYLVEDSEEKTTQSINTINYIATYDFTRQEHYRLELYIQTNNGYEKTFTAEFDIIGDSTKLKGELSATADPDKGRIILCFTPDMKEMTKEQLRNKNLIFRRSKEKAWYCNETNQDIKQLYKRGWEDVKVIVLDDLKESDIIVYDYLIEDGVEYSYKVQLRDIDGTRSDMYPNEDTKDYMPIKDLSDFSLWGYVNKEITAEQIKAWLLGEDTSNESIDSEIPDSPSEESNSNITGEEGMVICKAEVPDNWLIGGGRCLRVMFDSNVSSYSHQIAESKINTIGSKYPYIKRNGDMYYREFSISGLISYQMDEYGYDFYPKKDSKALDSNAHLEIAGSGDENLFILENDNFLAGYELDSQSIVDETLRERAFREKVMEFLYNDEVKLWKSASEGCILVRLTGITLTPNQSLGRRIYSFSATASEVADFSCKNCDLYGVQDIGTYLNEEVLTAIMKTVSIANKIGQYHITEENFNFIKYLDKKYKNNGTYIGYHNIVSNIIWIKITTPSVTTIKLNGEVIRITQQSPFEIYNTTKIKELIFLEGEADIDYLAYVYQLSNGAKYSNIVLENRLGQFIDEFKGFDSIYGKVYNKAFYDDKTTHSELYSLNNVYITLNSSEDKRRVFIGLRDNVDDKVYYHYVWKNGEYEILDDRKNYIIKELFFAGYESETPTSVLDKKYDTIEKMKADESLEDNVYITAYDTSIDGYYLEDIEAIKYNGSDSNMVPIEETNDYIIAYNNKILKTFHKVGNNFYEMRKITYNGKEIWVECKPISAIVDYVYTVERGTYRNAK